ncbi:DMT family transporter [Niveibacterium sp. SC-1]|uniref:DMT family transporter n=1 Tax=Niveibacterium sp. SC-1 TaxID=3135646 RepID=UPI00311F4149
MSLKSETTGLALAVVAALGFSAKAIFVKLAFPYGVDALTLLALRVALAGPVFLFLAWRSGRNALALTQRDWLALTALGLLGYYGASLLDFMGLAYISAGLERLILFVYPTLTLLISVLAFGHRASRRELLAVALAWAGIAFAFSHDLGINRDNSQAVWLGAGLVFASAVCYALYLAGAGQMIARLGSQRFTALAMSISTVACLLHFSLARPLSGLAQPAPVLGYALAMAIFSTVLPVFALSAAIRRLGAARCAVIGSVGPVITIGLGIWLLGEPLSLAQVAGTVLVLGGVSLAGKPKAKATPQGENRG